MASSQLQCAPRNHSSKINSDEDSSGNSFSYFHFILGEMESLSGNTELSLEHFLLAGQFDVDAPAIKVKQAEQLVSLNRVTEAKSILNSVTELNTPEFHLLHARISALELDLDSAVDSIDRALTLYEKQKDFSKIRETVLMKVALLSDSRKFKEAIRTLNAYIKREPNDEIAYYFLGKIYSLTEDKEEAEKAYKRALEIRPQFTTAAKSLGLMYELSGDLQNAIQIYTQALRAAASDIQLRQKLANLYLATENFAGALEHLRFLVSSDPDDLYLQLKTALVHFKLEQLEEAEVLLKRLVGKTNVSQDRVHFYLGALYEEKGSFELATTYYLKVSPESDYFTDSRLQSAFLFGERLKKPEKVAGVLNSGLELRPMTKEFYLTLATFYDGRSQLKLAIETLVKANSKIEKDEAILFALGSYLDKSGDYQAGIARMREVLQINPNHAHALNHIGYILADKRIDLVEAEALLLKAVQLEPNNAYIVDSLGWLYHQKGDYQKAREILEKANQLNSSEAAILEHLADVYTKLGLHDLALKMYQKIVDGPAESTKQVVQKDEERNKRIRQKIASINRESF